LCALGLNERLQSCLMKALKTVAAAMFFKKIGLDFWALKKG